MKSNSKSYQKRKDKPNTPGPGFRTPDNFKMRTLNSSRAKIPHIKFNPAQFRTQHKG